MGAAGFFGYHLTSALLARGDSVEDALEGAAQFELVFETHSYMARL